MAILLWLEQSVSDEGPKGTAAIGSYFKNVATQERSSVFHRILLDSKSKSMLEVPDRRA